MKKIAFFEVEDWETEYFKKKFTDFELQFYKEPLNKDDIPKDASAEGISVFVSSKVGEEVIKKFPNLKIITTRSTGFDHIDAAAAKKHNVAVSYVPYYGMNTVAEFTMGLILTLSRKLYKAIYRVKEQDIFNYQGLKGFDLKGKTLGVIGTGNIGRYVIKMAKGFEMNVIAYDAYPNKALESELGFKYVDKLETLLGHSDIITLHVPLLPTTQHLINKDTIDFIKKGAYLVNTSRGEVIETEALALALKKGILAGVALDVLEVEGEIQNEAAFLKYGHPNEHDLKAFLASHILMDMDNVVVTPHTAFNTQEALERILDTTIDNIRGYFAGKPVNQIPQK